MIELYALFKGRVQGVGFRHSVKSFAEQLGIKGTVKNLSNGSVELIAQGSKENLELLLLKLQQQPGLGRISSIKTEYRFLGPLYEAFKIIY